MKESKEILKNRENYTSAKHYHRPIIYRIVNLEIWDVFLGGGAASLNHQIVYKLYTHGRRRFIALRTARGKWPKHLQNVLIETVRSSAEDVITDTQVGAGV